MGELLDEYGGESGRMSRFGLLGIGGNCIRCAAGVGESHDRNENELSVFVGELGGASFG
jgi:hypothetical protein